MSKALVIKNADFSANKIETITFNDVPCTGVSFNSQSVSVDKLGAVQIGYTLTPSDTSDTPIWSSSDTSVIDIENGAPVAVGIGTTTITLACGSHSATCTATVAISESPVLLIGLPEGASGNADGAINLNGSAPRLSAVGNFADGHFSVNLPIYQNSYFNPGNVTAIKIPANTASIHVEADHVYGGEEKLFFVDANTPYVDTGDHMCVPVVSAVSLSAVFRDGVRYINQDVPVPNGATGYIVYIRPVSVSTIGTITNEADLVDYAENTHHLSISYTAS